MENPIRVLHVDDEPDFAELAKAILERESDSIEVVSETDPERALERLDTEDFDCVVSDYQMPMRTGLELLKTVRENHPELPFILFTGRGSEEIASEAISAGVTDYIQKGGTERFDLLANRITNAVTAFRAKRTVEGTNLRFRMIAEAATDAIITVNEAGAIVYANPSVERIFGYSRDELENGELTRLIPPELRDRHRTAFDRYLETGERQLDWSSIRFRGLHKDGSQIPLNISFTDIHLRGQQLFTAIIREADP